MAQNPYQQHTVKTWGTPVHVGSISRHFIFRDTVKAHNKARAEALAKIQTPSNIKDVDHKIQKYVQWDMLYQGVYTEGGCYIGWALLGAFTVFQQWTL